MFLKLVFWKWSTAHGILPIKILEKGLIPEKISYKTDFIRKKCLGPKTQAHLILHLLLTLLKLNYAK